MKLDWFDYDWLLEMYLSGPTGIELHGNRPDLRRKLYRLSRAGLCRCDKPGDHPGQPRCWGLTIAGERIVEYLDTSDVPLQSFDTNDVPDEFRCRQEALIS